MSSDNTTTTQQSSQTNPYAPSVPLLTNEAALVGGINTSVTPQQQAALGMLQKESGGLPDLSQSEIGATSNNLNASTAPQQGMLNNAYTTYMKNTGQIADNTDLNPWDTPGFKDAMDTMSGDIMKNVKSQYAGSGRDPSGAGSFGYTAGRGIAAGEAPAIAAQYGQNVQNLENANAGELGAAGSTASGVTNAESTALTQQLAGLQAAGLLPGTITAPGTTALNTANAAYGVPWTNLSPALAATEGIGGMGGTGSGTGSTTQSTSAMSNILGLLTGAAGVAGAVAKSDARLKENIKPVGELHDGQTVHQFNWKDDPKKTPQLGLLAQEVEKVRPDAVHTIGGIKHVDYQKATQNARRIGMLQVAA